MGPERRDGVPSSPEERGDIADAYAPPVPPSKAARNRFLYGVLGVLAVCIIVFVIALALR